MATVGEMVKHSGSLTPLRKTQYARQCGRMDIANVLHHLGIWDAEVLEGVVLKNGEWIPRGPSMLGRGHDPGDLVRVIVLPKEE